MSARIGLSSTHAREVYRIIVRGSSGHVPETLTINNAHESHDTARYFSPRESHDGQSAPLRNHPFANNSPLPLVTEPMTVGLPRGARKLQHAARSVDLIEARARGGLPDDIKATSTPESVYKSLENQHAV